MCAFHILFTFLTELYSIAVVCVSFVDNSYRATRGLPHFAITFPQYCQLSFIVLHQLCPVHSENMANTSDAVLCQNFAVIIVNLFQSVCAIMRAVCLWMEFVKLNKWVHFNFG